MASLAADGNRVLFVENTGIRSPGLGDVQRLLKRVKSWAKSVKGFRKERDNLFVYSPVILPFPFSRIGRFFNRRLLISPLKRWMKAVNFNSPIAWTFLPTGTALDIIDNVDPKLVVYYCIADFRKLVDDRRKLERYEKKLLEVSDVVFAQCKALEVRCRAVNVNVHVFPFGVNFEYFNSFIDTGATEPSEVVSNDGGPVIGYVGGLHRHVDYKLIRYMAEKNPEWLIVLVGPVQANISEIKGIPNILLTGKKDFSDLPAYISRFDACVIPYILNEYTETVLPTKLNEYHAMGKPVVSTELPEVAEYNRVNDCLVYLAGTHSEFCDMVEKAIKKNSDLLASRRILSAKKNGWSERIAQMEGIIESSLAKKSAMERDWRTAFLKFYRKSNGWMLKSAVALALAYILIFYTPLAWVAAKPLAVYGNPESADCIVVFGGGVGESGKAGQGYEERVERAVQLYKAGHSRKVIFSSGYKYAFDEPTVMKALAVYLGLPESDIMLEEKAKSTYEHAVFTARILKENGWNRALLVSSPYHMLRASMVFRKLDPGLKVTCMAPIRSRFYERQNGSSVIPFHRQINWVQLKGLLHEYVALAYYWIKGYV